MSEELEQLASEAFFVASSDGPWVLGNAAGTRVAYALSSPREVLELDCGEVVHTWSAPSRATYFACRSRSPVLRFYDGAFERMPIETQPTYLRLAGRPGARPEDDRIALATCARHGGRAPVADLWRGTRAGFASLPIGRGMPVGIACEEDESVVVALSAFYDCETSLVRALGDVVTPLALPSALDPETADLQGMERTPAGELVVMVGTRGLTRGPAEPWLLRGREWTRLASPEPLVGFASTFSMRAFGRGVYIPAQSGTFLLEDGVIRKQSDFRAVAFFPCDEALVVRGYRGQRVAHEIMRAGTWERCFVAEPEAVLGAKGKRVSLAGTELPMRRARLPHPKRAPSVHDEGSVFSLPARLARIAASDGVKKRRKRAPIDAHVHALAGSTIAGDLRAYVELLCTHAIDADMGHWLAPPEDFFGRTDSVRALADSVYTEQFTVASALTGAMPLGLDGGGQIYFAELSPERSEVYTFAPDLGRMGFLASSFEAFAELTDVAHAWSRVEDEKGFSYDDFDARDPAVKAIRARAEALDGKVCLQGYAGGGVATDFDDMMRALVGKRLHAVPRGPLGKVARRAEWMIRMFVVGDGSAKCALEQSAARDLEDGSLRELPSTITYWLWHFYFTGESQSLRDLASEASSHESALVRRTAELVSLLDQAKRLPKGFERFAEMRASLGAPVSRRPGTRGSGR